MEQTPAIGQDQEIVRDYDVVKVIFNPLTGQNALIASTPFSKGDIICKFGAKTIETHPTYLTIQLGEKHHITLMPEFLQFTNHSCDPNVFFDTQKMEVICVKDILPGDEIVYFYPGTEWEMDQPFKCNCGSPDCLQIIRGASYLASDIKLRYRFTEFISVKMKERS